MPDVLKVAASTPRSSTTDAVVVPAIATTPAARTSAVRWVFVAIACTSLALGVLAYYRYRAAERYLRTELVRFRQQGAKLEPDRCVYSALQWSEQCSAMLSLCDASISRVVLACLEGQPRTSYCHSHGAQLGDARQVFHRCQQLGVKGRRAKQACVGAYRMLYAYCRAAESPQS